ncbi:MAG: polysaccharide biosynthesis/export family protein [Candidatus Sulfotelmatobacter sp.]
MQHGRVHLARSASLSVLSFVFVITCGTRLQLLAQTTNQSATNQSAHSGTTGALPAAEPLSDAAIPQIGASAEHTNLAEGNSQNSSSQGLITANDANPSMLKLAPGDLIELSVYDVPELSTKARVGNSGDIYLPLIDYVHVADLTIDEAQAAIQKRLEDGGFVRNAHVTIFVDESSSQGVTILGEVVKPGIYPALADRKLYDFISAAGGFTAAAGRKISVIRQHGRGATITVELPRNLADDLKDNVDVFPGDTITIPRAPIIYVVGDVGHPAGLLIDNGSLTVLQAIALAGGTNHTAKIGGVRIIRKGPAGMTETKVPLKKMLEAKAPDITLQADDILFVPLSGARVAASQGLQAVVTATTGIAIIAAHP